MALSGNVPAPFAVADKKEAARKAIAITRSIMVGEMYYSPIDGVLVRPLPDEKPDRIAMFALDADELKDGAEAIKARSEQAGAEVPMFADVARCGHFDGGRQDETLFTDQFGLQKVIEGIAADSRTVEIGKLDVAQVAEQAEAIEALSRAVDVLCKARLAASRPDADLTLFGYEPYLQAFIEPVPDCADMTQVASYSIWLLEIGKLDEIGKRLIVSTDRDLTVDLLADDLERMGARKAEVVRGTVEFDKVVSALETRRQVIRCEQGTPVLELYLAPEIDAAADELGLPKRQPFVPDAEQLLRAYGEYIAAATAGKMFAKGWVPVPVEEFAGNECRRIWMAGGDFSYLKKGQASPHGSAGLPEGKHAKA